MNWVYGTGTKKREQVPFVERIEPETVFSSLSGLDGSSTLQRTASPPPPRPVIGGVECLGAGQFHVVVTIFTAEVGVELSQKMSAELHRSVKKNPPRALKYELIYVCHLLHRLPEMLTCLPDGEG